MHFNSFRVLPVLTLCYAAAYSTATSVMYARDYFYVGGNYVQVTSGNVTSQYMTGQIYVEKLTPALVTMSYPIIFIAGAGQTGTNFLHTPDGREGWAHYFLSRGYVVYLTDQPERGRSPWLPGNGQMVSVATSDIESLFTASQDFDLWPQASLHTQWPGTGLVGDPVFDAFYATQVQLQGDRLISEANNAAAYTALVDYLNQPVYLLTHSQAGSYGWRVGDARPDLVKKIVALEPSGPPFENDFPFTGRERTWGITDLAVEYDPPAGPNASYLSTIVQPAPPGTELLDCILQADPPKQLVNLANVSVLVVTSESSFHAPYDYCTVDYLKQAGVPTDFLDLPKAGIMGNGHMMFMEMNNLEIAERILAWIEGDN
jgi:pimeloyl-ACP methyl ester carboxylesterase